MHCSNCGSYIPPGFGFVPVVVRLQTIPKSRASPGRRVACLCKRAGSDELERTIFSVRPTMIFIKLGYLLAVLGGIGLVVLLALVPVSPFISIPLALALLLIPAYYHLKRNMIRYTLTDSKIEIDTGLIARTTRNIPLSKIQDVTVSASIPQRVLGFGDLIVDNASELGGTTVLHNINKPRHYADLLLRELRRWH